MRWSLLILLAAVGCKTDDSDPEPLPGGSANYSASLGEEPDFSVPTGRIAVRTLLAYNDISLSGGFFESEPPTYLPELEREGNCRLIGWSPSTCSPECEWPERCLDGECVGDPAYVDRGPLEWTWPGGQQTVSPDATTAAYWASGSISQEGEMSLEFEELLLEAPVLAAAEPKEDFGEVIDDRKGGDATLKWTNPILDARVRLYMTDCVGSHGGLSENDIECEGPDTGELVIAATLLDALEAGDWSHGECGSMVFYRYHAAAPVDDTATRFESRASSDFFWRPGW